VGIYLSVSIPYSPFHLSNPELPPNHASPFFLSQHSTYPPLHHKMWNVEREVNISLKAAIIKVR
jgi:hypothetical protein